MRPEHEVLLSCAHVGRQEAADVERLRTLLRRPVAWSALVSLASRHGLLPLLVRGLCACEDAVPPAVLTQLRASLQQHTQRALYLTGELVTLLRLCAARGIAVLPFKGPALAAAAYDNPALRQFEDLDILVRRRDAASVKELLRAHGYRPRAPASPAREAAFFQFSYSLPLVRDRDRSAVDLHWDIGPREFSPPLDVTAVWDRRAPLTVGGQVLETIAADDLLLMLCVHGGKHLWERLVWLCDVARLLHAAPPMDWARVLRRAREHGATRFLFLGLRLAHVLLGAPLPVEVRRQVEADPVTQALAAQVQARLFCDRVSPPGAAETHLFYLRAQDRLQGKLRYCVHRILTPTTEDWELLNLPSSLVFLYPIFRPVRLAGKYARRLFGRERQAL